MTFPNSNIYEFHYHFLDLDITASMITGMMGYSGDNIPDNIPGLIEECIGQAAEICAIKGGYLINDDINIIGNEKIMIGDVEFNTQGIITNQIKNSEMIALFICTAGPGIDSLSKLLFAGENMLGSYIVDTIGIAIVETAMDKIQKQLETQMNFFELKLTNRFSPGYCDWDVQEQQKLFGFFPPGFCGIRLTDSCFMYPSKSVSGIIGIGKKVESNSYYCKDCSQQDCIYRKQ